MTRLHLLLVDDEPNVVFFLKQILTEAGYDVSTAGNTLEAITLLETRLVDLLIVDWKLPGPSGVSLVERAHALQEQCAIVMISGNATREQIIEAFRAGADDFLLKPVRSEALQQAAGRALLKHHTANAPSSANRAELIVGSLTINLENHRVCWHDQALALTPTEFCLLLTLARRAGQNVAAAWLVQQCRGYSASDEDARLLLKPHIASLRQKLEQEGRFPRVLINHRGVGFSLTVAKMRVD